MYWVFFSFIAKYPLGKTASRQGCLLLIQWQQTPHQVIYHQKTAQMFFREMEKAWGNGILIYMQAREGKMGNSNQIGEFRIE